MESGKLKKIIVVVVVGAALAAGLGYYYTRQETTGIYPYRPGRDKQVVLDLFKNNLSWLVSQYSKDFSAEFFLTHQRSTQSGKRETIKVMLIDGQPVGFVAYYKKKFYEGFIHFLAVKESARNKGYGRKLLQYAIDDLTRQGVKFIRLVTLTINYPGQKVYKVLGFKEISRDDEFVDFQKDV